MGKQRVAGNNVTLSVKCNNQVIKLGEIDKFSAKKKDDLRESQPIGDFKATTRVVHKGWELSFEGGKVDWNLAQAMHAQDTSLLLGSVSPYFVVQQEITYYNGQKETFEYVDVSIHGYEIDVSSATEDLTEKVEAFASERKLISAAPDASSDAGIVTTAIAAAIKSRYTG